MLDRSHPKSSFRCIIAVNLDHTERQVSICRLARNLSKATRREANRKSAELLETIENSIWDNWHIYLSVISAAFRA